MKVASLLYDLLEICPNTKLHSKKVVAALKAMQQNHDVFFPETKHATALDMMDKVDVTDFASAFVHAASVEVFSHRVQENVQDAE